MYMYMGGYIQRPSSEVPVPSWKVSCAPRVWDLRFQGFNMVRIITLIIVIIITVDILLLLSFLVLLWFS